MEITDIQKRRAINLIWNAAQDYSFQPDFKVFDNLGNADLYWNCIIGSVRKIYEYPKLEKIFLSFQDYDDSYIYENLLWLALENAVFEKEVIERPALSSLRTEYAQKLVLSMTLNIDTNLCDAMYIAHYLRVLGKNPNISKYDIALLDELEFSSELTTDEIVEKSAILFSHWFQVVITDKEAKNKNHDFFKGFLGKLRGKEIKKQAKQRKFAIGLSDYPDNIYGGSSVGQQDPKQLPLTQMTDEELRAFIETKFGKSIYSIQQITELERTICTGNHANCHLHITCGEPMKERIQNGFEALQINVEAKQKEKNRYFYSSNIASNKASINKLKNKIQNSVLLYLLPSPVKSNSGKLVSSKAWKAIKLNDNQVFTKNEQEDSGNLSVDLLLDASTSQKNRQELVSTQAYIIAESLTKSNIPCRVMSFKSMAGYTILRIFRDYNEPNNNDKVFEYISNGCNRDGLAIKTAHQLMLNSTFDHKILIVLSDVKPNDIRKVKISDDEYVTYEDQIGINDTAIEVRKARADGISVICVFTGDDEDVPSAKTVYGKDFARITSINQLADTVGKLLQNQIKNF